MSNKKQETPQAPQTTEPITDPRNKLPESIKDKKLCCLYERYTTIEDFGKLILNQASQQFIKNMDEHAKGTRSVGTLLLNEAKVFLKIVEEIEENEEPI